MLADKLRAASSGVSDPAWNLNSAVYQGSPINFFYVGNQEGSPQGISFKPDGLKMYVIGPSGDDVNEYNLSTAWNVSTASYLQNFSINTATLPARELNPTSVFFNPDGLKMFIVGTDMDTVFGYDLSTAWNVSTASFIPPTDYFSVANQDGSLPGIFFKPDGLKMYIVGTIGDNVYEYNLSTAWNVSTASYLQAFYVGGQELVPQGIFFKPDGLKMYIVGSAGDDVNEYSLSTAWNISTAIYLQNFSVAAQDTNPTGIFFKPDGLKMYVVGSGGDAVYEYNLSTAWDISTASYLQNFSVGTQDTNPTDIFFKPDGLKMYVVGDTGNDVNEYNLSTAWDISTASYLRNFSVGAQETAPQGIFFKPDGLKMYIVGGFYDVVWSYDFV